jgi:Holliday junction resolvasome RuvABC ATP-dependent DNA helicase subunit
MNHKYQQYLMFPAWTEEEKSQFCRFDSSPECPTFCQGIVGNRDALARISRIIYDMLGYRNHCCHNDKNLKVEVIPTSVHPARNIALIGLPGTGKTTFARLIANATGLPLFETQGTAIGDLNTMLADIGQVLENFSEFNLELCELGGDGCGSKKVCIPPMVVFIDEVHTLKDRVVQGLLKATEAKDRVMTTEKGWMVDCKHITWVIATTKRGLLDKAFDRRFSQITLNPYNRSEIAQIIQLNTEWEMDICELVTKYSGTNAGKALLFVEDVQRAVQMNTDKTLTAKNLLKEIARQHGIDEYGMPFQVLNILNALAEGAVSKARICGVANVEPAELENYIMPPLLTTNADGEPPLVAVETKGYVLTKAGEQELKKRKEKKIEPKKIELPSEYPSWLKVPKSWVVANV